MAELPYVLSFGATTMLVVSVKDLLIMIGSNNTVVRSPLFALYIGVSTGCTCVILYRAAAITALGLIAGNEIAARI